jgi:hypothetical protein
VTKDGQRLTLDQCSSRVVVAVDLLETRNCSRVSPCAIPWGFVPSKRLGVSLVLLVALVAAVQVYLLGLRHCFLLSWIDMDFLPSRANRKFLLLGLGD